MKNVWYLYLKYVLANLFLKYLQRYIVSIFKYIFYIYFFRRRNSFDDSSSISGGGWTR